MSAVTNIEIEWLERRESSAEIRDLARRLRRVGNSAEETLWGALRGRRFLGLKFRRQHALGRFIADFYCTERRLVVEVDGAVHETPDQALHDQERDRWLAQRGITIVRIPAAMVSQAPEEALLMIVAVLDRTLPRRPEEAGSASLSPPGRGTAA